MFLEPHIHANSKPNLVGYTNFTFSSQRQPQPHLWPPPFPPRHAPTRTSHVYSTSTLSWNWLQRIILSLSCSSLHRPRGALLLDSNVYCAKWIITGTGWTDPTVFNAPRMIWNHPTVSGNCIAIATGFSSHSSLSIYLCTLFPLKALCYSWKLRFP